MAHRDAEFENDLQTKEAVLAAWNKGWDCLFNALNALQPEQLIANYIHQK